MIVFDPTLVAVLVVVALVVGLAGAVVGVVASVRLARLRQRLEAAFPGGADSVVDVLAGQSAILEGFREDVTTVHRNTERLHDALQGAISRIGMVRYDAFDDVAGAQSFSAALLDKRGDGIVISAINGRQESRCYGKEIRAGESEHTLSDEERAAVKAAIEGRGLTTITRNPRRRRKAS
jgi:hypothetical protein